MRFVVFCLLFFSAWCCAAFVQPDSSAANNKKTHAQPVVQPGYEPLTDSVVKIMTNKQQRLADSIALFYLKPDPKREDQYITSVMHNNLSRFNSVAPVSSRLAKASVPAGRPRNMRDAWIIAVIIGLLIYVALLNVFLSKDIRSVLQSFYNKHALSQSDKEAGLINSWAFVGLFLLFSLTFGLVLYQITVYRNVSYSTSGFQLFLSLSLLVVALLALKFLVLKFIGFVFDIGAVVSEYIGVLNLTYFNIGFIFLAVGTCFSLISAQFIPWLLRIMLGSIAIVFAWQYLRNSVGIISNFRFHKFYLFIYLCALEICPILILIKALNI